MIRRLTHAAALALLRLRVAEGCACAAGPFRAGNPGSSLQLPPCPTGAFLLRPRLRGRGVLAMLGCKMQSAGKRPRKVIHHQHERACNGRT